MDEEAILRKRSADWARLTELSLAAEAGFRKMSGSDVLEFVRLYRKAAADLSLLSTQTSNTEVIEYLNGVVSRAYGQIYRSPNQPLARIVPAALLTAAETFRRTLWSFCLCAVIFFGAAGFTFQMMQQRPDLRHHFVPPEMEELFSKWKQGSHDRRKGGENLAMTAFYAQNNPRVGVMTNAVSVASFGTITTILLWNNGAILGALAHEMNSVGKLGFLLSSIAPHGVSEIGGILVTASGGFVLAWAMIRPGRRSRSEAMRFAGRDALTLLLTGLVMILIAAPIEGFFSFNPGVPQTVKLAFACVALVAWTTFFAGYGNKSRIESN